MQSRRPIEDFDRRGNRDQETKDRKDHAGIDRLAAHEHVMPPNQESDQSNRHAGKGNEAITENPFAREARNHFAHNTHARKNHDVHCRMRIEPKQVLEQHRVAAQRRIEDANPPDSFERHQTQRDRQHRRRQHQDQARGVQRPDEQRQAKPGQPRRPHFMDRNNEVQPGENRPESGDENSCRHFDHVRVRIGAAIRRVKRPAGINSTDKDGVQRQQSPKHEKIPAQQIEFRKGDVPRANHHRDDKISEHGGDRGDEKEPNHQHTMNGEQFVVRFRENQVALGRD